MSKHNQENSKLNLDMWLKITCAIRLAMNSRKLTPSYEEMLRKYLHLTVKHTLSESDSSELEFILSQACRDESLMTLTQLIDQHVDLVSDVPNTEILAEIEAGRTKSLERILGTAFDAQKPADSVKPMKENPQVRPHFCRRILSKYLLPLSVTFVGLVLPVIFAREIPILSRYTRETVNLGWIDKFFSDPEANSISAESPKQTPKDSNENFCHQEEVGWVSPSLDGHRTAYGEVFRNSEYTAAHAFLPPGSKIHMRSETNSQSVEVEVNDRNQLLMVSYTAAHKLGVLEEGIAPVTVTHIEIREEELDELNTYQRTQLKQFQRHCQSLILHNYQTQ